MDDNQLYKTVQDLIAPIHTEAGGTRYVLSSLFDQLTESVRWGRPGRRYRIVEGVPTNDRNKVGLRHPCPERVCGATTAAVEVDGDPARNAAPGHHLAAPGNERPNRAVVGGVHPVPCLREYAGTRP